MKELKKYVVEMINKYPGLREEIVDFYQLCQDEIEQGESTDHEIQLCYSSINDLIAENE